VQPAFLHLCAGRFLPQDALAAGISYGPDERASPLAHIRHSQKDAQLTELYKLHTPFVVAFLAFVLVFVVAHARK